MAPKVTFMSLPPEIRNRIYRETLVEDCPIFIFSTGFERSGLLGTNKQIRKETLKIYYYENSFWVICEDWHPKTALNFYNTIKALQLKYDARHFPEKSDTPTYNAVTLFAYPFSLSPPNGEHWANFVEYLKQVHSGALPEYDDSPRRLWEKGERRLVDHLVASLMSMVGLLRGVSWGEVENVVELQRTAFGVDEEGWMEE